MIGALLVKDARLLLRNRALLAALLVYPLLLAMVLGSAFREPPTHLDVAVYNGDEGGSTLDVGGGETVDAAALVETSGFARLHRVGTEEEAVALVRRGDADAALLIPPGFVGDLARLGSNATLRVIVDESDPIRASVARNAVTGGIESFTRNVVARKIADVERLLELTVEGGTTRIAFMEVDVLGIDRARARLVDVRATLPEDGQEARKISEVISFLDFARGILGNSGVYLTTTALPVDVQQSGLTHERANLRSVALPGVLVLSVFWTGALAAALLAARERETGAARRIAAAHLPPFASGASKTLVSLLAALLPAALLLLLAIVTLDGTVTAPMLTLLALTLTALAAVALGTLCAALTRASAAATLLAVLALVPMLLLGGLFYPVAYMPGAAQAVARVLPLTLATDALRGAMLRSAPLVEVALPLGGLVAFAVVAGLASFTLARRRV